MADASHEYLLACSSQNRMMPFMPTVWWMKLTAEHRWRSAQSMRRPTRSSYRRNRYIMIAVKRRIASNRECITIAAFEANERPSAIKVNFINERPDIWMSFGATLPSDKSFHAGNERRYALHVVKCLLMAAFSTTWAGEASCFPCLIDFVSYSQLHRKSQHNYTLKRASLLFFTSTHNANRKPTL